MGKFDGTLICTDLDGTLLKKDKTVSDENLNAIKYFKSEGGIFTYITGRMPFFTPFVYNIIKPNAPFGCINGGGLYDHRKMDYIWKSGMPHEVIELVGAVAQTLPKVAFQINTFEKVYFCRDNTVMKHFRKSTGLPELFCRYDEINKPIAKIVFGSDSEEEITEIKNTLMSHPLADNFDYIRSEATLFEILPKGINKGVSIIKLCEKLDLDINKTIAIGDYNNDIPMFKAAKLGIAVKNACPDALAAADFVTVSNEEHAVAKVINDLKLGNLLL